jgi:Cu-processing system permease protein
VSLRTLAVARDLLREARARRWVLALFAGVTLVLVVIAFGLELEVVDGALAAVRLFGDRQGGAIRPADVALRPLFQATAGIVFYGGLVFGILACADFAPSLLAPGRIEHLLALPVRRAELLLGTFGGVLALVLAGALFGGGGLTLIVWVKAGVFNAGPIFAAALAAVTFSAFYAAMLAAAVAVRSAALSASVAGFVYAVGLLAGKRSAIGALFAPGVRRSVFLALSAPFPRLIPIGDAAVALAGGDPLRPAALAAQLAGTLLFAAGLLAVAVALFERKDY